MLGIILWYNAQKGVGLVWCEDQGPLAFVGPEVAAPKNTGGLGRGAQIWFECEESNGFRKVVRIEDVPVVMSGVDPAQVLAGFDRPSSNRSSGSVLRVVA